jgi:hypothetical protein
MKTNQLIVLLLTASTNSFGFQSLNLSQNFCGQVTEVFLDHFGRDEVTSYNGIQLQNFSNPEFEQRIAQITNSRASTIELVAIVALQKTNFSLYSWVYSGREPGDDSGFQYINLCVNEYSSLNGQNNIKILDKIHEVTILFGDELLYQGPVDAALYFVQLHNAVSYTQWLLSYAANEVERIKSIQEIKEKKDPVDGNLEEAEIELEELKQTLAIQKHNLRISWDQLPDSHGARKLLDLFPMDF